MLKKAVYYYFSPTGGTRKVGELCVEGLAEEMIQVDLGAKGALEEKAEGDLYVVAVPVFGGRIPTLAAQKLKQLQGTGKKAVTMVVYGVRAYEDALLELNDIMKECGFAIVASAAFIAQHSIVPEVGKGRPDSKDAEEIRGFAAKVLQCMESGVQKEVCVPGNRPYKPEMNLPAAPMVLPACALCGNCAKVCPTEAVKIEKQTVSTNPDVCILCMACVQACGKNARILPPPLQEKLTQMLMPFAEVYRENEMFFGE